MPTQEERARHRREATASTDGGDDSPIEQVVTRSITRAQALERAGDLVNQVRNPKFNQFALKDPMGLWLTEPVIRVLPMDLKKKVLLYCSDHLPDWSAKIEEHYYDLRDEYTWQETIQVAPVEQAYGIETLGLLLAELKAIERKIEPREIRKAVTTLRRKMRAHAKYWDKLSQDVSSILKGSGTSLAEQRETLAREMDQQRRALDEERQAFTQQRQTLDEELTAFAPQRQVLARLGQFLNQRRQALDRDHLSITQQRQSLNEQLQALDQERQAVADTTDLETLWEWFLDAEVTIPPVLRMVMQARCSCDTLERLAEMENARN
ncbi:hypothetical protein CEP54_003044 [Fusarium duplospermum]|uniref:Uncharacterized protein n=1 Tax=Fusarium duplospermum TaxID=1325734 RepID=A0A428QRU8_9HYPO|nr:hypothetical protein CEP54_003044 [Fusarium duplospermum]